MAKVSISQAAKLAGISRATIYNTYINKGKISVSSDPDGKKYIDTSEILRVFGKLASDPKNTGSDQTVPDSKPVQSVEIDMLRQQAIEAQRRELEANRRAHLQEQDFSKREAWYQSQIQNLTDTMKLLEAPKQTRLWWQFWK